MRIALVCPYNLDRPGGVATHVLGLARWLNATGHEAKVVAPGTRAPKDVPVLLLGPTRDFRFNGSTAQLAVSASQRTAARAAVQGVDVVHVHEPLTPGAAYTAAKAASPLVVTHHASFTVPAMVAPLLRYRAKKLGPRLSLAVSEAAARTAQAAVGHRPPIIPNAIRLPDARPPLRSDTPRVVFLGRRDDPRKGYAVFHALAQSGIEADFVAIGPGGDPGPGVRSLGILDDERLSEELRGSSVVVASNLGGESFGMVLIEALAAGCTLVASDLPAFREVVGGTPVARWFRPGETDAARAALLSALGEPADPDQARLVARRYAWESIGPRIVGIYRASLGMH